MSSFKQCLAAALVVMVGGAAAAEFAPTSRVVTLQSQRLSGAFEAKAVIRVEPSVRRVSVLCVESTSGQCSVRITELRRDEGTLRQREVAWVPVAAGWTLERDVSGLSVAVCMSLKMADDGDCDKHEETTPLKP